MNDAKPIILKADEAAIGEATTLIRAGQCVAVPTETVYGLAADATNGEAVARIYATKGRPDFNPLIVHVPDIDAAMAIGEFHETALELARIYWPGPLTLVVPFKDGSPISRLVTAGLPSVALRCPAHPVMQDLLDSCGRPLAAPSANASGSISPTKAEHVARSLGEKVPLVLDGGPCAVGLESTIVAVGLDGTMRLLRPGPIDLGIPLDGGNAIEAPGQLASHYAPSKKLRLYADTALPDEWLIGFGDIKGNATLSANGDLVEAASKLFELLHQADESAYGKIAVAPVPETGLGLAINDRLKRAAA